MTNDAEITAEEFDRSNALQPMGGAVARCCPACCAIPAPDAQDGSVRAALHQNTGGKRIAPMITVEVRYRHLTKVGKLRHPVIFYRLRDEIAPAELDFPAVLLLAYAGLGAASASAEIENWEGSINYERYQISEARRGCCDGRQH
jgi:hypothetical protein